MRKAERLRGVRRKGKVLQIDFSETWGHRTRGTVSVEGGFLWRGKVARGSGRDNRGGEKRGVRVEGVFLGKPHLKKSKRKRKFLVLSGWKGKESLLQPEVRVLDGLQEVGGMGGCIFSSGLRTERAAFKGLFPELSQTRGRTPLLQSW